MIFVEHSLHPQEIPPLPNKERQLLDYVKMIEVPLMEALQKSYGETRGWRMCGPAAVTLSQILSAHLSIPIGRNLEGEHIELAVGIYDPQDHPDRFNKMEEQTYIRYYLGNGEVYYVDPIYGLLMEEKNLQDDVIKLEKFSVEAIDANLIQKYHLYPFNPEHSGLIFSKIFKNFGSKELLNLFVNDSVAALNDERATLESYIADSGLTMNTSMGKTRAIIRQFVPEWTLPKISAYLDRLNGLLLDIDNPHLKKQRNLPLLLPNARLLSEPELIYHDQAPKLESWKSLEPEEVVLTFHTHGERFVLKEGQPLMIFNNGRQLTITTTHLLSLEEAVRHLDNQETTAFHALNIPFTKLEK